MPATDPVPPEPNHSLGWSRLLWIAVAIVAICISLLLFNWIAWMMLVKAISRHDVSTVAILLRLNPTLAKQEGEFADTGLAFAVEYGNSEIVRLLIEHGSDMYHDRGRIGNPCNYAAWSDTVETMRCFVEAGYDIEYQPRRNGDGTCLHKACSGGNAEVVQYLIEKGADANALERETEETPLMKAVCPSQTNRDRDGKVETVKLLLKAGARLDLRSKWGETALESLRRHLSRLKNVPPAQVVDENTFEEYRDIYLPFKEIEQLLQSQ